MPRAIIHPSFKLAPREIIAESLPKPRIFGKNTIELKTDSEPSVNESIVSASLKLSIEQARPKFGQAKRQNLPTEHLSDLSSLPFSGNAETHQLSFSAIKATTVPTSSLSAEASSGSTKLASPRSASKIPTPLSRKIIKSSPTNSDSISSSSALSAAAALKASTPAKMHSACNKSSTNQTSCLIPRTSETALSACATIESSCSPVTPQVNPTEQFVLPSASSPRLSSASARESHEEALLLPAERRRTVVEVCEKVVVLQGKTPTMPPVTPFITVNRVNADKQNTVTEIRNDQRASNVSKKF